MSSTWARLRAGDDHADLFPGCTIGRSWRSDLVVNDARVSEVHAYVTLRAGALKLRRLGGNLWVHGMPVEAATLRPGLTIALAEGLKLDVVDVMLPDTLPMLVVNRGFETPLTGEPIWVGPGGVQARPEEGAVACWSVDEDWFAGPDASRLGPEITVVDGLELQVRQVPRRDAELPATRARGLYAPMSLTARYDVVQLAQQGRPALVISGMPARLVSELAVLSAPAPWQVVAGELWPNADDELRLRRRWDKTLASLRGKLRAAGIRPDLVRSTGGMISLVLLAEDHLEVDV